MSTEIDPNDLLLSSGIKSVSFAKIGDSVVGTIARRPETMQQRDPATGEPKTWRDGKPAMQIRVILATDQRDPQQPDDNGERALYIKGGIQRAVAAAVRKEGALGLEVGGKLQVKYAGDGPVTQRGFNPPKLYEARYKKPAPAPVAVPEPNQSQIEEEAPF